MFLDNYELAKTFLASIGRKLPSNIDELFAIHRLRELGWSNSEIKNERFPQHDTKKIARMAKKAENIINDADRTLKEVEYHKRCLEQICYTVTPPNV